MSLKPTRSRAGNADVEEPLILLEFQGNQVEIIYTFVVKLIDLDIWKMPYGHDLFYQYTKALDTTTLFFRGTSWLLPAAQFVSDLKGKVAMKGWSNWYLPFIQSMQMDVDSLDLEMLGAEDFPAVGYLETIAKFIQAKIELESSEEVHDALEDEIKDIATEAMKLGDDIV